MMRMRLSAVTAAFLAVSSGCGAPRRAGRTRGALGHRLPTGTVRRPLPDRSAGRSAPDAGTPPAGGNRPEGGSALGGSFNFGYQVIHDGGVYRMFYRGWSEGGSGVLCYAESRDGVRWEKPNLRLVEVGGTRENNVVALVDGTGRRPVQQPLSPSSTPGPGCRPPSA